jgi:deazaflavin-dependent oxidoreductase (nitroreductase family)
MSEISIPDSLPSWIKEHIELYLRDGEAGHLWDASLGGGEGMLTTLLLTTTGRKSGRQLVLPLIYRPTDDGGYCIIASKGGAPTHPAWFLNLEADPKVKVKVANRELDAVARVAEGAEREALWDQLSEYYAPYNDYQAATTRQIPVVVLDPVPAN